MKMSLSGEGFNNNSKDAENAEEKFRDGDADLEAQEEEDIAGGASASASAPASASGFGSGFKDLPPIKHFHRHEGGVSSGRSLGFKRLHTLSSRKKHSSPHRKSCCGHDAGFTRDIEPHKAAWSIS